MQTYLGLDVGTYSIKAAVLKISSENHYIEQLVEQEIVLSSETDDKFGKNQALRSILSFVKDFVFDSIYGNLGAQFTVMKRFDLNNVKRGDRQKIIESEFDLYGLFNLDDYAIEYHTIKFDKNYARLLAILINKPEAKQVIDVLAQNDLSVRVIDIDNLTLLNLINFLPVPENTTSRGVELFLDFGHSKTTFTLIENNRVIHTRVFNLGGMHLTNLIKTTFNMDLIEAKNLKHTIYSQTNHKHYANVRNLMENFYQEIIFEMQRTIKTLNATEFIKISRLYITGGASKYEGLDLIIKRNFNIDPLNLVLENKNLKFATGQNVDFKTFSQCMAVAFRSNLHPGNSKINIRHGELALISNYEKIISEVYKYGRLASIFILVLMITYFVRSYLFNNRIDEMKTQYKNTIVKVFKNEPKELKLISSKRNWDFNDYSSRAIKIIENSRKDKKEIIENLFQNKTPLPIFLLNQVSLAIPKSMYFEVTNFKYQDGILFFEADSDNSKTIEDIITKIKSIKILTQVNKKSQELKAGSDGRIMHFVVTANVSDKGE